MEEKNEVKLVKEPVTVSAPAIKDKMVRVRNAGKPFVCDLTMYGYGMRWPANAVYNIPISKYMELLEKGLNGAESV